MSLFLICYHSNSAKKNFKANTYPGFCTNETYMYTSKAKLVFLLIFYFSVSLNLCAMQQPSQFLQLTREKIRTQFFPDLTVPSDQDWQTVNDCFSEVLKLELSWQEQKVTFADAKRYCEFASMYRNLRSAAEWFDKDHVETIKRFTNLIMFAVFYPDGSGSPYFGPISSEVEHLVKHSYGKIIHNLRDMNAIFNIQSPDFVEINSRREQLVTVLRNFKTNPFQRNKLEG